MTRSRWRHPALVGGAGVALAGVLVAQTWVGGHEVVALQQAGVARDPEGRLVPLSPGRWQAALPPDPRDPYVLGPDPAWEPERRSLGEGLAASARATDAGWLAAGWVPGEDPVHREMATRALLDLRALTGPAVVAGAGAAGEQPVAPGAVLAAPSANWRFVWPRDAAFVAVAYARTGHRADALAVLRLLQSQQRADGAMAARWVPDGTGRAPDDRPVQEDGPGWALWAVHEVLAAETTEEGRRTIALQLGPLVARSAGRLLERLEPATGLPRPSPDYWEVPEDELTLGVAATALMGLESAAALAATGLADPAAWREAGVDPAVLAAHAQRLRARVEGVFGPRYPRHVGRGQVDAAVTFVGPPFLDEPLAGAARARQGAREAMSRPAGGVAPGAGWKQDGISWTPETALLALAAAASGEEGRARHWLDWLAAHRTEAGSLPEKVLHDGSPAAVAPLAWTAALVLLTLAELECGSAAAAGAPGPSCPAPAGPQSS